MTTGILECKKEKTFYKKYCQFCMNRIQNLTGNCNPKPLFYGYYCEHYEERKEDT